jgi:hypothetical protein
MHDKLTLGLTIVSGVGLAILVVLALSLPTMWLWNYVMPVVFGLPEITLLQTLALLILSEVFFKGFSKINN